MCELVRTGWKQRVERGMKDDAHTKSVSRRNKREEKGEEDVTSQEG